MILWREEICKIGSSPWVIKGAFRIAQPDEAKGRGREFWSSDWMPRDWTNNRRWLAEQGNDLHLSILRTWGRWQNRDTIRFSY